MRDDPENAPYVSVCHASCMAGHQKTNEPFHERGVTQELTFHTASVIAYPAGPLVGECDSPGGGWDGWLVGPLGCAPRGGRGANP